jgi:DNA-binding MarR family transcriptional regulator
MNDLVSANFEPETVAALDRMTRALSGLTLQSLRVLDGKVSMPQFRLLLALASLDRVPCSRLASELGVNGSSVTRLADRMEAAGLVSRGTDPWSRSIVTLEMTRAGAGLVARAVERRRLLLAAVLDRMDPAEREAAVRLARRFAELAGYAPTPGVTGPLPL